jgi:phosphatidylglycerophosphate synthase
VDTRAPQEHRGPLTPDAAGSAQGLLVVLPPSRDDEAIAPSAVVAGLPLLRRIVLAAARAGFLPVVAGYSRREAEPCLEGTCGVLLAPDNPIPLSASARRLVFLPLTVVPQPEWLAALRAMPLEPDQLCVDGPTLAVLDVKDPAPVLAVAARCRSLDEVADSLRSTFKTEDRSFDERGRFALRGPRDVESAERWLLSRLVKENEGFMSRHFERRVSLALTRWLCKTSITPNMMTLVSVAIGLAGAACLLSSSATYQFAGALLFLVHSILDGCDGELARLKFLESRAGAVLDACGDNLVHTAVFLCLAIGWSLDSRSWGPLYLGAIAVASTLSVAAIVHHRGLRASTGDGPRSAVSRVADASVHRDFIYLVLLLAAAGKVRWFLVLTAIGAPLFLLVLVWLGRRR